MYMLKNATALTQSRVNFVLKEREVLICKCYKEACLVQESQSSQYGFS